MHSKGYTYHFKGYKLHCARRPGLVLVLVLLKWKAYSTTVDERRQFPALPSTGTATGGSIEVANAQFWISSFLCSFSRTFNLQFDSKRGFSIPRASLPRA